MGRLDSGLRALIDKDADLARAYELAGAPSSRKRAPGFSSLLRIIINQQVSVHAGRAIWVRLENGLGAVTPEAVMASSHEKLRGFGLSRAKAVYSMELASAIVEGRLNLKALKRMEDDEVLHRLTRIKGIGRWTAEIYLMFALGRPDIWPAGDLALAASVERLLELKARPDPKKLEGIAENWRPWRTSAAVLLWHYYSHAGPMGGGKA